MIIGVSGKIGSGKDTIGKIIQYLTDDTVIKNVYPNFEDWNKLNVGNEGHYWQIKKFAGKLKQTVSLLTGVDIEKLEDSEFKDLPMGEEWDLPGDFEKGNFYTYRYFLQRVGTDAMRNVIHPNFWVNALFVDYKPTYNTKHPITVDTAPNWIITDVRFPNELQAIKDRGGVVIRVNRYDITGQGKLNPHTSETALDNAEFDYVIDNYGTIEDLIVKVKDILIAEKII